MKKPFYVLVTALLLTGALTSCDKKLFIDPVNNVNADKALQTSSDVEAALVACYAGLQNVGSYGGYIQLTSDLLADDGEAKFVGTFFDPGQINRKAILKDNGFVATVWINAYNVINRANNVLANVDKFDSQNKRTRAEGEMKFIRAAMYFELVRLYAKDWSDGTPTANPGVPLLLVPTKALDPSNQVKRNTVAEVYAQVLLDLAEAEMKMTGVPALPFLTDLASNSEISASVAAGMLSRVYLQQARFPEAAAAANRATTGYVAAPALTVGFANEFKTTLTNEDLFAIQITAQSGSNGLFTFYTSRGDISITDNHANLYAPTDGRRLFAAASATKRLSTKYNNPQGYGYIKVMRLAEMLLTRAEANFRAGTMVGATPLADINAVRSRAGVAPLATLTLPAILLERKLELAFEGFRLGDLKRNKESATEPLPPNAVLPWNSSRLTFPIPKRETDVNPNLAQNEGYQ